MSDRSAGPDTTDLALLAAAGVGSTFEKTATGWRIKYVDGGTVLLVEGATITDAVASHGAQVAHPISREQAAREAAVLAADEPATEPTTELTK